MNRPKKKRIVPPPPPDGASCEELDKYFTEYSWDELEEAGYLQELSPSELEEMERVAADCRKWLEEKKRKNH